jgi:hypothetical protein
VPHLEELADGPVYGVEGLTMLRRSLRCLRNPFNFAATCYPRALHEAVEGYGGGRLINPDKWFHWKLLSVADRVYFVDRALFAYRWHAANQTAQEVGSGSLKYLVDEYVSSLELAGGRFGPAGLTGEEIIAAFIEYDIVRHGLATLARGQTTRAHRIYRFGQATYPGPLRRNPRAWVFRLLLTLGPLGRLCARFAYRYRLGVWPSLQ